MRPRSRDRGGLPWRARLLGGASLLCLTLLAAEPVRADDVATPAKRTASFYERFYISLEGAQLINRSPDNLDFGPTLSAMAPMTPGGNGAMAGVAIGGMIDPTWDWRVAWHGNWLSTTNSAGTSPNPISGINTVTASDKLWFQTFDGEVGYRIPSLPAVRLFVGPRVLNATNRIDYTDNGTGKLGNFDHRTALSGGGPRGGFEATVPVDGNAFVTMSGSGSVIFARRSHDFTFNYFDTAANPTSGSGVTNFDRSVTVYNVEASAALGYRFTPNSTVQIGYRVQQWWNLVPQVSAATIDGGFKSGEGDVLVHGPFAKITVALP